MNYKEYNNKVSKDFHAFPMAFAFSNDQLVEGMKKLGVERQSELVSIGCNGFIRKSDKEAFLQMIAEHKALFRKGIEDPEFCYSMFVAEMANHEYSYTYDDEEVLEACGLSVEQLEANDMLSKMYDKAKHAYLAAC